MFSTFNYKNSDRLKTYFNKIINYKFSPFQLFAYFKSSLSQYCIFLLGLGKTPWYSDAAHLFTTFKKPFNLMHFLKGKRTNIFIDDYCRPAKVFSWRFSMICSFYTFMEKGVGFFIPVYPLVFHHKKSLIFDFLLFLSRRNFKIPS